MDTENNHTKGDCYPNCDSTVWMRSCETEIVEPITGIKEGVIPEWINGALLRNGPGSLKVADMEFKHVFDSSALLHRFAIHNGTVTYQCRFLKTETYKKNMIAKRIVVTEFGTEAVPDPCHTIFNRIASLFTPGEGVSDNAMISIYPFGDEIFTFTESPVIHKIDPKTLDTRDRINLYKYASIINHTSHPHVLENGDVYNLGMSLGMTGPKYNIIHFPKTEKGSMLDKVCKKAEIPVRWPFNPGYMHTFGITDNYYIVVEQPLSVSVYEIVKTRIANEPMIGCLKWFKDYNTLIHVVRRSDGQIQQTFQSEAFFYLHIINQYEKDDHVVVDICCYKDPAMLECMYVESMKAMQSNPEYAMMFRARPMRFVLPMKGETVTLSGTQAKAFATNQCCQQKSNIMVVPELLAAIGCETPRINYDKYLGKEYQYFYAISSDVDADNPGTLIKIDTINKAKLTWCEENCYPSEPIFVAKPDAMSEDDGVILSAMVWGKDKCQQVALLVLDAKTLKELGRVIFTTPSPVPKCLHGWFLPFNN